MARRLISFDWAIKRILRSKANFDILEGFLSELLKEDVTVLEILESESNQEYDSDKQNRLDLKVKDSKGAIILIEIQYEREMDYLQRILFAASETISEHMKAGAKYSDISKVISISILYFDFGTGDDYIYKGTTQFKGMHNNALLELNEEQKRLYNAESVQNIFPEYYLIKVKNFNDYAKDSLDEWINFLKNEEIPDLPKAKGLLKAKQELDYLKMTDSERLEYDRYIKYLRDQASAYESTYVVGKLEGREEGREEETIRVARNLLNAGVDLETIKATTGLGLSTLKELQYKK